MSTLLLSESGSMTQRADELFARYQHDIHRRTDRLFALLMVLQWIAGIVFALWVSPLAWYGTISRTHVHVWPAVFRQEGRTRKQAENEGSTTAARLRITQQQAEAATRAKSDFLASMSHELRTPLNAIILYSELLQEEAEDAQQLGTVGDLQRIGSAGNHLLGLINGILDLSKIEAGKMTISLEQIDIRALVNDVIDTVAPLVQKNQNTVTVQYDDSVSLMHADLIKTRQILVNLVGNAAKFTRAGSIALDVRATPPGEPPAVLFMVSDTGVGMTAEEQSHI